MTTTICACGHGRERHAAGRGPCGVCTGWGPDRESCQFFHARRTPQGTLDRVSETEVKRGDETGVERGGLHFGPPVLDDGVEEPLRSAPKGEVAMALEALRADFNRRIDALLAQLGARGEQTIAPVREVPGSPQATMREGTVSSLGKCERTLLSALVRNSPQPMSAAQLAILSGYSPRSSGFANALGRLRSIGYVGGSRDALAATVAGVAAIPKPEPMPKGAELRQLWMGKLGKCESALLSTLAIEECFSRDELAQASGYSPTSSGFANALGRLRSLELVQRGEPIRISKELL